MSRVLDGALRDVYPERALECAANDAVMAAEIDPLFAAAHYMDGRDLIQEKDKPEDNAVLKKHGA